MIALKIGYIRVSSQEQNTIRQEVLMESLGVDEVYIDRMSGKRIIVHAPDKSSGHRTQKIEIKYNFVGVLPVSLVKSKTA